MRTGVDDDGNDIGGADAVFVDGETDEPLGTLPVLVLLLLLPGWKTRCRGRFAASTSKSPRTMYSSGAMLRRNS